MLATVLGAVLARTAALLGLLGRLLLATALGTTAAALVAFGFVAYDGWGVGCAFGWGFGCAFGWGFGCAFGYGWGWEFDCGCGCAFDCGWACVCGWGAAQYFFHLFFNSWMMRRRVYYCFCCCLCVRHLSYRLLYIFSIFYSSNIENQFQPRFSTPASGTRFFPKYALGGFLVFARRAAAGTAPPPVGFCGTISSVTFRWTIILATTHTVISWDSRIAIGRLIWHYKILYIF
jgi:hypothetical protein